MARVGSLVAHNRFFGILAVWGIAWATVTRADSDVGRPAARAGRHDVYALKKKASSMAKKKGAHKNRSAAQSMLLAGTIPFPTIFPELGLLTYSEQGIDLPGPARSEKRATLTAEQLLSPRLTIWRTFFVDDVAAVFLPDDEKQVKLADGEWLLKGEVKALKKAGPSKGIVYVRENAPTLLYVQVGMTAAESAEYYPPLPDDRSLNHYRFSSSAELAGATDCGPSC
jgi:hypothetical protein